MRSAPLRCLVLVLLASATAAVRAQDTTAESNFRDRVSWGHQDGRISLQSRPDHAYLVGGLESAAMISEDGCDCEKPVGHLCEALCNLKGKLVVFEVTPVAGFTQIQGGKCQDRLCVPDTCPPDELCDPNTLPLAQLRNEPSGRLPDLSWRRSGDALRLTSTAAGKVFWLLEDSRARMLFPGETLGVKAPAAVYSLDCIGQLAPEFTPASQLEGGCPLQPCRDRPLAQGLCSSSQVFSNPD